MERVSWRPANFSTAANPKCKQKTNQRSQQMPTWSLRSIRHANRAVGGTHRGPRTTLLIKYLSSSQWKCLSSPICWSQPSFPQMQGDQMLGNTAHSAGRRWEWREHIRVAFPREERHIVSVMHRHAAMNF